MKKYKYNVSNKLNYESTRQKRVFYHYAHELHRAALSFSTIAGVEKHEICLKKPNNSLFKGAFLGCF